MFENRVTANHSCSAYNSMPMNIHVKTPRSKKPERAKEVSVHEPLPQSSGRSETLSKMEKCTHDAFHTIHPITGHGIKRTDHHHSHKVFNNLSNGPLRLFQQGGHVNPTLSSHVAKTRVSRYEIGRVLGNGSFGLVCKARQCDTGEQVAIKKVLQDPEYKNRELGVMKELDHPNIVLLKDYFFTECPVSPKKNTSDNMEETPSTPAPPKTQRFLNVVMEYVPETVYHVMKSYHRKLSPLPLILIRLYTYQLCRSLGYLHSLGFCHRDIKPHNLLVNPKNHVLKLCDFGSAKRLHPAEPSVSYICSRFYRAPELMLGATEYTTAIDIWSMGCVLGEFLAGKPIFPGESSVDQLVKIIRVLGTPTRDQMRAMNPNYSDFQFPNVHSRDWTTVLLSLATPRTKTICFDATHLLSCFLKYDPKERLKPYEALTHPFFDPLYNPASRLPDGSSLPNLFNFSEHELAFLSNELKVRTACQSPLTKELRLLNPHVDRKDDIPTQPTKGKPS